MVKAAVLGFGTVGSGVVEHVDRNQDLIKRTVPEGIEISHILDLREFPDSPYRDRITKNFEDIINDPEIKVICEAMGGVEPAYTFTKRALEKGIGVCTSNKELVITKGAELIKIAKEHGCSYLFEASVGGGIPVIRPIVTSLSQERILSISGILNGTTNYILSRMCHEHAEFETVLHEAMELGYAERNPAADVEGYDACRKIAILASMVTGKQVHFEDISCAGITDIIPEDFLAAKAIDRTIKLLGVMRILEDGSADIYTAPCLIPKENPLSSVEGVFNAVCVNGEATGDIMFYGKGAGKEATASAVVSDMVDAVRFPGQPLLYDWDEAPAALNRANPARQSYCIRVERAVVKTEVPGKELNIGSEKYTYFVTDKITEEEVKNICGEGISGKLRVF